jgi:hypothetical protein
MKNIQQLKQIKQANQDIVGRRAVSKKTKKEYLIVSVLIQPCNSALYELASDRDDNFIQGEENDVFVFIRLNALNSGRIQLDQFLIEYNVT